MKAASQATVEFVPKDEVDFTGLVRLTARQVHGCLGLINIANGTFDARISGTRSDVS
jgi:synaptojanin